MFHHNARSHAGAAVFSAILALAAIPVAASAAETRTVLVHAGDLNLANDTGRAMLQQRITHAVAAVCGSDYARTTEQVQAYANCSKQARANAVSQFDTMVAKAQAGKKVALGNSLAASE